MENLKKLNKEDLLAAAEKLQAENVEVKKVNEGLTNELSTSKEAYDELVTVNQNLSAEHKGKVEELTNELTGTKKLLADASGELVKAKADLGNQSKEVAAAPSPKNDGKSEWEAKFNEALVGKRKALQELKALKLLVGTASDNLKKISKS